MVACLWRLSIEVQPYAVKQRETKATRKGEEGSERGERRKKRIIKKREKKRLLE